MIEFLDRFEQKTKNMRTIKLAALVLISVAALGSAAAAQRKSTRPAKKYPPTPRVVKSSALTPEMRAVREKVDNQIENVTRFQAILGPVAAGIEDFERNAKNKKMTKAEFDANELNKRKVMQAIRNLRAGLASLETDFRTKPELKKYLPNIQGITDISARCEQLGAAGQFAEAGRSLTPIIDKLNTTRNSM